MSNKGNIKYNIINFILPTKSKRRLIVKYIYKLFSDEVNCKDLKEKIKKYGLIKAIRYSFNKLVILTSREYQEEKYKKWMKNNNPSNTELEKQRKKEFDYQPLISIITPLYNIKKQFFLDYINSIQKQTYSNWEICLVDTSETKLEYIEEILKEEKIKYKKIRKDESEKNRYNIGLEMATGEYIALIEYDDQIPQNAFYEIVKELNNNSKIDFIYTDEDKFEGNLENRYFPFFKPDFSPDFLRSNNYISHLSIIRKSLIEKVGGFREEFDNVQDYELILRVTEQTNNIIHIPKVLYHKRVSNISTLKNKKHEVEASKKAIKEHCDRMHLNCINVEDEKQFGFYRVKYEIEDEPLISIIIPNKDALKYIKRAIKSILKSTYRNYEIIIVENNSERPKTFKYYNKISKNTKIEVVTYEGKEFNYSKINNYGVQKAKGKYILLLNNDTKIINRNWLEEMLSLCQREEVGIVGAKLLYKDKTIQHAGVIVGMGGVAGHVNRTIKDKSLGYFGRVNIVNNFSAVTAACLMTKKELYNKVKGLDENFKVAFNDTDFCMKIRSINKLVVYTPYAKLYHYESKSRGIEDTPEKVKRFNNEQKLFKSKWEKQMKEGDPYFNINLDLYSEQCEIKDQ